MRPRHLAALRAMRSQTGASLVRCALSPPPVRAAGGSSAPDCSVLFRPTRTTAPVSVDHHTNTPPRHNTNRRCFCVCTDVVEAALPAPPLAATLSATMPSRFCGLSVTTAGGRVDVAVLQEAALRLETRGGDVAVRRARASSAVVSTMRAPGEPGRGGCVAIGELSASLLRVASGGGALRVDRVAALEAEVLTGGGTLSLGAL